MAKRRSAHVTSTVKTIKAGSNCFLVKSDGGFVLIDTGVASKRAAVEKELASAGCGVADLKLIVLTHGDSDHVDNGAYLRKRYGAKIAMHRDDVGMVEHGDMSFNRKAEPDRITAMGWVIRLVGKLMLLVKPGHFDKFSPDVYIQDGESLSAYGLDASVLHLPGHSKGSLGVLTSDGSLFCGDLIYNFFKPNQVWIDDMAAAKASVERLKASNVRTVYPGHGKPFPWEDFVKRHG